MADYKQNVTEAVFKATARVLGIKYERIDSLDGMINFFADYHENSFKRRGSQEQYDGLVRDATNFLHQEDIYDRFLQIGRNYKIGDDEKPLIDENGDISEENLKNIKESLETLDKADYGFAIATGLGYAMNFLPQRQRTKLKNLESAFDNAQEVDMVASVLVRAHNGIRFRRIGHNPFQNPYHNLDLAVTILTDVMLPNLQEIGKYLTSARSGLVKKMKEYATLFQEKTDYDMGETTREISKKLKPMKDFFNDIETRFGWKKVKEDMYEEIKPHLKKGRGIFKRFAKDKELDEIPAALADLIENSAIAYEMIAFAVIDLIFRSEEGRQLLAPYFVWKS